MSKTAGSLSIGGKSIEPAAERWRYRSLCTRHIEALWPDGDVHLSTPGFTSTASCESSDHLHRWRQRRPPVSRLSNRAAGRERLLSRELLPPALRRATDEGAVQGLLDFRVQRHTMVHEQMSRFFQGFRRDAHIRWPSWSARSARMSAFYHDVTGYFRPEGRG